MRTTAATFALIIGNFILLSGAAAQTPAVTQSPGLEALAACRTISSDVDRLACYDRAAGELSTAAQSGDLVVVERKQMREARRQLFGFNAPNLSSIFSGGGEEEEVAAIETTLTRASQNGEGKWTFHLADGGEWLQIDSAPVRFRNRPGLDVRVRRAALGSYLLTAGPSRAVRVKRQ